MDERLVSQVLDCLTSSLDLQVVMASSFPLLGKLLSSDQASLCVSNPRTSGGYDWTMIDFPLDWFRAYPELAPHDFIRFSVMSRPNLVLVDAEMCPRREFEENMMYRRAQELGMPVQHVMAVMLDYGTTWHAGATFYRHKRMPFSEENRQAFQRIVPIFAHTLRNCKLFAAANARSLILDELFQREGREVIVMLSPTVEWDRSPRATGLIDKWFDAADLNDDGLPRIIADALVVAIHSHGREQVPPDIPVRQRPSGDELHVAIVPISPRAHFTVWAIIFQEVRLVPTQWREQLTPRELEVVSRIIRGWDYQLIAEDLACALTTVKKHVQNIREKLGADHVRILQHRAMREK